MKQSTKDWWAVVFGILMLSALILIIPVVLWARIAAPCKYVDWLPAKDVPARCLVVHDR